MPSTIDNFRRAAFRVEALPEYTVDGGRSPAMVHFYEHGELPKGHNSEWVDVVSAAVNRGAVIERLRLVSSPLTEYERYEITAGYGPGVKAGERIRIAERRHVAAPQDFWAYDDDGIEWLEYDAKGGYLGARLSESDDKDRALVASWRRVFDRATPLDEFLRSMLPR